MGYFELFGDCYPELQLNRGMFVQLLDIGGCTAFEHKENDDIVGFAAVKDNSLRLICVSEKYRRQGIGSELLAQAEEHIGKELRGFLSERPFQRRISTSGAFRFLKSVDMLLMTAALKWSFCLMIFPHLSMICPLLGT